MTGNEDIISQLKMLLQFANSAPNPTAVAQTLLKNSPRYNEIQRLISQNGGDPKAAFYNLAKEKGVDPDSIINMLRQ